MISLIGITGCRTIEYVEIPVIIEYDLENPPEREIIPPIKEGQTLNQYLLEIVHRYDILVDSWGSWGILVYETLDIPLPESLKYLKQEMEK